MHAVEPLYRGEERLLLRAVTRPGATPSGPELDSTHVELPEELRNRQPRKDGQEPTATLTLDAYDRLKAELAELEDDGRDTSPSASRLAREHGDIRENAEYDAAKNEQGLMESKIRKLQQMLRDPEIVEAPAERRRGRPGDARHGPPARRGRSRRRDLPARRARRGEGVGARDRHHHVAVRLGAAWASAEGEEIVYEAPGGSFRYVVVGFEPHTG